MAFGVRGRNLGSMMVLGQEETNRATNRTQRQRDPDKHSRLISTKETANSMEKGEFVVCFLSGVRITRCPHVKEGRRVWKQTLHLSQK